jgi:hypothetical protein
VNRVVEAEMDGAALRTVSIVPEDVLMREKTDQLRADAAKYSKQLSRKIVATLGMATLAGYAAFFVSTAVLPFGSVGVPGLRKGVSVYSLLSHWDGVAATSHTVWLYLALASFLIPVFVKKREAFLSLFLPLLFTLGLCWAIYSKYSDMVDPIIQNAKLMLGENANPAVQEMVNRQLDQYSFANVVKLGLGFYAQIGSAIFLAWVGFRKYLLGSL